MSNRPPIVFLSFSNSIQPSTSTMNAAFIIFFACFGACMATDARMAFVDQLLQQGQQMGVSIMNMISQQILALAQQASQQLQQLAASLGGRFDIMSIVQQFDIMGMFKPILQQLTAQVTNVLSNLNLSSIFGGRKIELGAIFADFWSSISHAVTGMGQHFVNQGLSAVLGGLGSLGGRGIGDIFSNLSAQIAALVNAGQSALSGIVGNITSIATGVLDASKPHWEQLQEQLVGHGLNVLNTLGQTINDLHGSVTGGR